MRMVGAREFDGGGSTKEQRRPQKNIRGTVVSVSHAYERENELVGSVQWASTMDDRRSTVVSEAYDVARHE